MINSDSMHDQSQIKADDFTSYALIVVKFSKPCMLTRSYQLSLGCTFVKVLGGPMLIKEIPTGACRLQEVLRRYVTKHVIINNKERSIILSCLTAVQYLTCQAAWLRDTLTALLTIYGRR